jgi:hypothetical protein
MQNEIKTLNGIMNLDDSNEVMPSTHHKEARNGVFKGNAPEMHFTAIRGNSKVDNNLLVSNDCRLSGSALFTPNCNIAGDAVYIGKCDLAGTAVLQVNFTITSSCVLNDGNIIIGGMVNGSGVYEIGDFAYATEAIALASTAFTEATSKTFNNMPDGTLWFVIRDKNNTSNKIAKSVVIACNGTSTECRSGVTVTIGTGGAEVFYQDCCGVSRSVLYTTAGSYTISDCIKAGSLSSQDNGFLGFTYGATACNCVNFALTYNCGEGTGNSTVEAQSFTGGGGTYQISNMLHTSAANALAGTFIDVVTTAVPYYTVPDGLWYVALRDKANTLNKIVKSIESDCVIAGECSCYSVVNTTADTLSVEFFACDGNPESIGMPGGSIDWICVANGTIPPPVTGLTITKCSPAVSCITNSSCFSCGSTDPFWVDQGYNTCVSCITYDVYKDENPNSASAGKYKVNGEIGTTTAPTSGDCNTDANYSDNIGTYYSCSAGTINENTVYENTNTCFTGNQYKAGTVTYTTDPSNESPDTDPILTDQGYYTCYNCSDKLVYKNTNECSPFYGYYYVNGDRLTTTAPAAALCPTEANWVDLGFQTCYGCQDLQVYQNQANCVTNSYKYRIGGEGGVVVDERPSNVLCNTLANWVLTGFNTCSSCANYAVYRDTNGCSSTYNQYRVNNVVVGATEPTRGNCITTANYQNFGSRVCVNCTSYQPQKDMNPCSATAGDIKNTDGVYGAAPCNTTTASYTTYEGIFHYCSAGTVYEAPVYSNTNVCFSGVNTAQFRAGTEGSYTYYGVGNNPVNTYPSTTANWFTIPIEAEWICDGTTKYYKEVDLNQCSPTGGDVRQGALYATNSTDCGYVITYCTLYELYNYDSNYDAEYGYTECGAGYVTGSLGPGRTMNVCSADFPYIQLGQVTNLGTCGV